MAEQGEQDWGVVGARTIGGGLIGQLAQEHVAQRVKLNRLPSFIMRSTGIYSPTENGSVESLIKIGENLDDLDQMPSVVFNALPSDKGDLSKEIAERVFEDSNVLVTAEKALLSEHWDWAKRESDAFSSLGINATVGGGNRLIELFQTYTRDPSNVRELHVKPNGTLTFMEREMSDGVPVGIAANMARDLGYADPLPEGATPMDVIRAEATSDIPRKTSILFNALGLSEETLNWEKLQFELEDDQLAKLEREIRTRRFIVSVYGKNSEPEPDEERLGGFRIEHDGWTIVGGFRRIGDNPMFDDIADYSGTANGGVISLGPNATDGVYPVGGGPGAGPKPTVNTMLDDSLRVRNI